MKTKAELLSEKIKKHYPKSLEQFELDAQVAIDNNSNVFITAVLAEELPNVKIDDVQATALQFVAYFKDLGYYSVAHSMYMVPTKTSSGNSPKGIQLTVFIDKCDVNKYFDNKNKR